ncbi:hypothetical protein SAMN04487897_10828 [Paenibacillus sp. yr247]|uniref:hypothetical protein n=1 Tax=Paenibacillus sp. yr247 TaxID=1761880 RepID=UPI0008850BA9|nr:hypothetical protein [Paenibacillus sp. yr247]SDO08529.1 hypothetical protein SAMN04487897_10828 [Paenibacillus sp. yr247]
MVLIGSILDLIVLGAAGRWLLPHVQKFLEVHAQLETNYAGRLIPRGLGIVLWLLLWFQELILQGAVRLNSSGLIGSIPFVSSLRTFETNNRMYTFAAIQLFSY